MIRGTTPTLRFKLPFSTDLISIGFVTISQRNAVVIDKPFNECTVNENILSVTLTQAETLLLDCTCNSEIQIRAKTADGNAVASRIITVQTDRILKDGEI